MLDLTLDTPCGLMYSPVLLSETSLKPSDTLPTVDSPNFPEKRSWQKQVCRGAKKYEPVSLDGNRTRGQRMGSVDFTTKPLATLGARILRI